MNVRSLYFYLSMALMLLGNNIFAAVPIISYSPSTNIYTVGTAISTLTPGNSGGAVAGIGFGTATALTGATLNNPRGIGIDASGNIYVTNTSNNTISKYNASGTYLGTFGTGATMSLPKDIVFDSSGNAYVLNLGASAGNGSVYKYNSSGVYQSTILSSLNYALGITIDNSDNIYIADQGAVTVKKYSTSGSLLLSLPTTNFSTPLGVATDASGNIYVLNNGTGNVTKYNSAGTFQSTFLSGYTSAQAIAIDGAGNIYVGDNATTNIIKVYNLSGTLLTSKTVTDPQGIAVDKNGIMFVSSYYSNQMNKYIPTGGYFLSGTLPAGLSFDSTTGYISGTPTAAMAAATYTITAYNASGSATTTVNLTVNPTAPTGTGGSACYSGTASLSASGSSPSGGVYNWYAALSGGSSLGTGATFTTPAITATTTYYVSYTQNGATSTPRTAVTATLNASPIISTAPTTPTSGLYLSYSFSGNANDISGNSNNGTVQGSASLTTDRYNAANSAYSFNGSSQYISTTTQIASPGPTTFSISVWIKTTTTSGGKIVGFGNAQTGASATYDRHIYMNNAGQLYFGTYNGSVQVISTATAYNDGAWHHIVATQSTTNGMRLYVDGAFVSYNTAYTTQQTMSGYWRIGYDNLASWPSAPTSYYFNGSIDDVAVYNSEITPSQVYVLNGAGSSPICAGSTLTLQVNTVAGATYSWTGPNSFTSSSQNPTISSATSSNAGIYTVTVTGSNGCQSVESCTAVVNALPSALFTATSTVNAFSNATVTYTGTDPSTSTYAWDFDGGTPSTGTGQGPFSVQWSTTGTKTITLTVTNASTCSDVYTQNVTVNSADYSTYGYRIPLTLNTTGLGISTDLTNFPFLVSITDPGLVVTTGGCSNKVQYPNGPSYDFAFYDASAGEIPYDVESYDQTTGTLLAWVKLPTLSHTTNNTLTFYYGSATAPSTHTTAFYQTTWASDYKAVFHFNEASYTGSVTDGTSGGHTGTTSGMTSADLVTGKIGTAYSFNGSTKKITTNAVSVTGAFTLSAWVKLGATGLDQKIMTNQSAGGGSTGGYKLGVFTTNYPEVESGVASNRATTPNPTALTTGTWYYVQGVYTGTTLSTYVNGAAYKTLTVTNNPSANASFYIGVGEGGGTNNFNFNGLIDEPRVSNVAKTADWIKAEYTNQNNPSSFTTLGTSTTSFTNASAIKGGIVYTTSNGSTYSYTINSTTTTATPPTDGTASYIVSGTASIPASTSVYALTVNSSQSVDLNGKTINVGCNIVNSGTISNSSGTSSTINFNGSASTQTYTGTSTSVAQVGNLIVNNSSAGTVTLTGGGVSVYTGVTITSGNLVVDNAGSGALTLKSTATQTAGVAAIPSAYSITGTVNVERYVTGGVGYRGYRLMSSPIYGSTVSSNNVFSLNYLKNTSYLTGTTGTGGGFDKTGNPTIYLFRENMAPSNVSFISGNFRGINTLGTAPNYSYLVDGDGASAFNIPVGNGFLFFFRGDRSVTTLAAETSTNYTPTNTVFTSSGTLNQQQVIVHNWYTPSSANLGYTTATANTAIRGYNLVGNPYASSIDWETYNTTTTTTGIYAKNVGNTIYIFNPASKNYDTYQKGGVYTNNGTRTIASGQGFFVQVVTPFTTPQLIFNESAKVTTQNTGFNLFMADKTGIKKVNSADVDQHLRLQLAKDAINTDDIYIGFRADAKPEFVFNEDAGYKSGNGILSLASFSADHMPLAINKLPLQKQASVIPLKVGATTSGVYTFNMKEVQAIPQMFDIWLMDAFKKDSLDVRHNTTYAFDLNTADTNSYGSKRFSLVIRQNPALFVHLLDFTAQKAVRSVDVKWLVENEQNYTHFTLERSTDKGITFDVLTGLSSSARGTYSFTDLGPVTGENLYRLKMEDYNGDITYSKIVPVMYANINNFVTHPISVYPNPSTATINLMIAPEFNRNSTLTQIIDLYNPAPAVNTTFGIKIVNNTGFVMKTATTKQQTWQTDVSRFIPGTYIIQVTNNDTKAIIGQSTFVKL